MPPNPQMAPNGAGGPMGMMGSPKMSPFGGLLSPMGGNLLQQLTQGGGPNSILKLLQNAQPQTTPGSTPSPVNPGQMPQGMQQ
jgi:hypothetical protein